ncbi:PH domain-containing protein [Candidatus Arthromitus sp. SFB-rat-Yit]|uniref:PH domain-containing protein n=1 Tax=Candidatus Arthromitus sp. SFB-rat-Yit TaxID=1041504 RepID=UPI000227A2EF|nr:PH domain-containing protein [Candidatus Arthromitus sp. SFB-rat-Yit]BAK80827.1 superfamily I DNA and RNA helicase [Candidatus Arthromitus sp. SFB-rat-Yit]
MGVFSTLMGNASSSDPNKLKDKLLDILFEDEEVVFAFSYVRDIILFTSYRIMFTDKQGVSGKKESIESIPYRSVVRFSIETKGVFDLDSEFKIWISGKDSPIESKLSGDKNILELQRFLGEKVCKK